MTNSAYLLIGGNMGDKRANLSAACAEIEKQCGPIGRRSSLYETAAWGLQEQDSFFNQALLLHTGLEAKPLLDALLRIEERLGRRRHRKYGPRTIDIDILFFNHAVIDEDGLTIPHPQLQNRRFVLEPLSEIAPDFVHPLFQKTVLELLAACADPLDVHKIS